MDLKSTMKLVGWISSALVGFFIVFVGITTLDWVAIGVGLILLRVLGEEMERS